MNSLRTLSAVCMAASLLGVPPCAAAATPSPAPQSAAERAAGRATLADAAASGQGDFGPTNCKIIARWARCGYPIDVSHGDAYLVSVLALSDGGTWKVLHAKTGSHLTAAVLHADFSVPTAIATQLLPPGAPQ